MQPAGRALADAVRAPQPTSQAIEPQLELSDRSRRRRWTAVGATLLLGLIAWAALPFVRPQAEGTPGKRRRWT